MSRAMELKVSVPQGSVAGANIFTAYSSTSDDLVPKELNLNGFADDHSIRTSLDPNSQDDAEEAKRTLETTMGEIKKWMNKV